LISQTKRKGLTKRLHQPKIILVMGRTGLAVICISVGLALGDERTSVHANPIRKVVTMLQNMQSRVQEEAKKEEALYDKFMCYCKTSGGDLDAAMKEAKSKLGSLEAAIKSGKERKTQTEADVKEHMTSRAEAKEAMAAATALREKEAAAFAEYKEETQTNLAALGKAIAAIENGMAGGFLQTTAATGLRKFIMFKAELPDETRQEVLSFLSGKVGEDYAPQSGQITGILKQIEEEMAKALEEASTAEADSIKNYEALMTAKTKEVDALTEQIEEELTRIGDLGVEIASMENDYEDTEQSLGEDTKFLAELGEDCVKKEKEWSEIQKTRADEMVALAETIKILNDDDALELFKKTLPSAAAASLVQVRSNNFHARAVALASLKAAAQHKHLPSRPEIDLIALALSGKKVGFEKVIKMIDDMVANLKREQVDDDSKKEYCEKQLDMSEDKKKELAISLSDSETAIEELEGGIATLTEEIAALKKGIKALDKSVAEATEQRKEENAEYKELKQSDTAAKEILLFAKNRLNKFYNPKLYKPPPKVEEPALVQIAQHTQHRDAPPAPPETFGPYTKKSEGAMGVTQMIDLLVKDLDKELTEAEVMEESAQKDYEGLMAESATKRVDDSKSMSDKSASKAAMEEALGNEQDKKSSTGKELMSTLTYIKNLHAECDWLIKYFDARADARAGEIDALGKAKSVLSGADFSLLQTKQTLGASFLRRK